MDVMPESLTAVRSRIEALGMDFRFKGTIRTGINGIERETWLLDYQGEPFVYVAGQRDVVLGWDVGACPLGEGVLEGLRAEFAEGHADCEGEMESLRAHYRSEIRKASAEGDSRRAQELAVALERGLAETEKEYAEMGYRNWEDFMDRWEDELRRTLSPLRTADIGDMIVEVDSRYYREDAPSLEQAVRSLKGGPFGLATEDEWEYLCNGGARTLFWWGDVLDSDILAGIYRKGRLKSSNVLGLRIAYNSYKNEIIDDARYTKGGDGGGALCGGNGAIHVLPCYSAFYRYPWRGSVRKEDFWYRRILRLT